jgi:nucleotide-binding universal stress UspA family protein
MRILLAVDGSDHSEASVNEIARQTFPDGSEVRIISAAEPPYVPEASAGENVSASLYNALEKTARELARAAVDTAAATLRADERSRHLNVTTDVIAGSAKRVILEDAEAFGADLIVVGSHGRRMLERFLLGSVSQAVALHAICSVEIVRRTRTPTSKRETE